MSELIVSELMKLRDQLQRGFFANNLEQMLVGSMRLAVDGGDPLVFYSLASVLDDICRRWEGRPVPTTEVDALYVVLSPHMEALLKAVADQDASATARDAASRLVGAHLQSR